MNSRGVVVRSQILLPPDQMVRALLRYDAIPGGGSNVVVRRTTWEKAGPFDTRLRSGEDWEMWIRLAKLGLPACVCSPLVAKRLHDSNATLDIREIVRGAKLIQQLHHTTADWGRLHRWMGHVSMRAGQPATGLGQFGRAVLHGEVRGVAADLRATLKPYLIRRTVRGAHAGPVQGDPWIQTATAWLEEFERSARETAEAPVAAATSMQNPALD
jgi:hypothetical protein